MLQSVAAAQNRKFSSHETQNLSEAFKPEAIIPKTRKANFPVAADTRFLGAECPSPKKVNLLN